jgi:hypothetical protein
MDPITMAAVLAYRHVGQAEPFAVWQHALRVDFPVEVGQKPLRPAWCGQRGPSCATTKVDTAIPSAVAWRRRTHHRESPTRVQGSAHTLAGGGRALPCFRIHDDLVAVPRRQDRQQADAPT